MTLRRASLVIASLLVFVPLGAGSAAQAAQPVAKPAASPVVKPAALPAAFGPAAWSVPIGTTHLSSPVIADVNGDGVPDVVSADLSGILHVVDGRSGAELPGWPQAVQPVAGITSGVESSPTVVDLNHDGHKEIVVSAGGSLNLCPANQPGGVVAFSATGTVLWRMAAMDIYNVCTGGGPDGVPDGIQSTVAAGDIDGSGFPSLVFGGFDHRIYALDRFGHILPGFPIDSRDTIWVSAALYDTAHTGRMDIFIGGDSWKGTPPNVPGPCGPAGGGIMRAIRYVGGGPQVLWQQCQNEIFQSSPAIGDLEGNGRMSMVVGTGTFYHASDTPLMHAWHLDDGSPVPGWPVATNGPIFGSPVIGDITGDGKPDVVVASCAGCAGRVYAFHGNGSPIWNVAPGAPDGNAGEILSTPILVDLNGDGVNDVAIGMAGSFYFLRGQDGANILGSTEVSKYEQNSAAVANFGPGIGWRMIIAAGTPNAGGRLDSFPLPIAPATPPAWPQWRLGPDHLGAPLAPPPPPAHEGYWLAGSDGGIFTFGNAGYYGSTGAMHLNQPIVTMARTASAHGYWMAASDGGIFTFGDAAFFGSTGAMHLNRPIVGMSPTPSGNGYWLVASDGGIFTFGDAGYYGSTGAMHLNQPIVGMSPTPDGRGYWLVAADGGMFTFGDAAFLGSTGAMHLNRPIVNMTSTASGHGYRLVASDGGIFAFGDATFLGSTGAMHLNQPIIGMSTTPTGPGYWLIASDGGIFAFGDAVFFGSTGSLHLNRPIVTAAASRWTA